MNGIEETAPASGASSEEVPLSANTWVRQIHRWTSLAFTAAVVMNFVVQGQEAIALWVGLLTLLPLSLLLFTGLYMFVRPYLASARRD